MLAHQHQYPTPQPALAADYRVAQGSGLAPLTAEAFLGLRLDLLAEHCIRWFSRRRTRAAVLALTAAQRDDAGLSEANFDAVIADAVDMCREQRLLDKRLARARRLVVQRTRRELMALDDRELDDIGVGRCDIERIAYAAQANVTVVPAANPTTTVTVDPRAANDLAHKAVA
ncbi:MAG: DUF1127 domain-containing protein [Alphaproteobacteria bacterium]